MAEELEILEIGKSIAAVRKSMEDNSRSIDRYRRDMDRSMGELRRVLVDLCLQSGITEVNGQRLSREDSHIFVHSRDKLENEAASSDNTLNRIEKKGVARKLPELDSAQMPVRDIEEKLDDNAEVTSIPEQLTDSARLCATSKIDEKQDDMEVNFKLQESSVSPYDCEFSLKSSLNLDDIYAGKLSRNVAFYELERNSETKSVQIAESVTGYSALELVDEMPESGKDGNEMMQLLEGVTENHALQVLDEKPKGNMVEKEGEWCDGEKFVENRENLHKSKECGNDHKDEMKIFKDTSFQTIDFRLEPIVSYVDMPYKNVSYKCMKGCFAEVYEQANEIERFDTSKDWWCRKSCSSMPICGYVSVEGQNFIVVSSLPQESELFNFHMKEIEKDDIEELFNYRSMFVSEKKEFYVTYEMVRKTFDVAWANELKKVGIRFIVINVSPIIILLLKACLESFVGKMSELERPPPEPPPRQLLLVHIVSVGKKLAKMRCIVWSKNKGLTQPSIYVLQPKYPHSTPWSLRTRTILRGWICYDPFFS